MLHRRRRDNKYLSVDLRIFMQILFVKKIETREKNRFTAKCAALPTFYIFVNILHFILYRVLLLQFFTMKFPANVQEIHIITDKTSCVIF